MYKLTQLKIYKGHDNLLQKFDLIGMAHSFIKIGPVYCIEISWIFV